MKISERGQITIPKKLRKRFGLNQNVEIEFVPTQHGLLIQKRSQENHPVDKVRGILKNPGSYDFLIGAQPLQKPIDF